MNQRGTGSLIHKVRYNKALWYTYSLTYQKGA